MLFTPSQFVGDADRALYEAKHSGRNCVRAASPRLRKTEATDSV
jgi:PleD family two-component response regulator